MKALRISVLLLVAVLAFPSIARAASAEEEAGDVSEVDKDSVGPLRERVRPVSGNLFLKKGRFEVSPGVGISVKDAFWTKYILGASLTYFLSENFAIGVRAGYSLPVVSGAAQICNQVGLVRTCAPPTPEQLTKAHAPGKITPLVGGLDLQWSPIYGKISLVSERFAHFDMYGMIGPQVVQYDAPTTGTALTVGGNIGLGVRFYFNKWLALRTELRDVIYVEQAVPSSLLRNQILVDFGFSMFFPTVFNEG